MAELFTTTPQAEREIDPMFLEFMNAGEFMRSEVGRVAVGVATNGVLDDVRAYTDANPDDIESERKRIFKRNINRLTKRFGETFVKGNRLDTGGYAGGGARELLSVFLDRPYAADHIKNLIPSTHQALLTLTENQDYIVSALKKVYEKEPQLVPEVPQDPYELASQAGYELTGPFEHVSEFIEYKKDNRPEDELCTFDISDEKNRPEERLRDRHIMWLRRPGLDKIVPADGLTPDNLTELWKDYLKLIGRYNAKTDTYRLDGLEPAREDPYGTSSMSVQIDREGTYVSVKNRYNHRVTGPDSTHHNDLDNVVQGLKLAVYHKLGRVELMNNQEEELGCGYVLDNNGGIRPFYYEENFIQLGHYEYINDGVVTTVDKGAYDMLSPELYVSKKGGRALFLTDDTPETFFEEYPDGTRRLHVYDNRGYIQQTYSYSYDECGNNSGVKLAIAKNARVGHICENPLLTELTVGEGASVKDIDWNPNLATISIGEGASVRYISNNQMLARLDIAKDARVRGEIRSNDALVTISIAEGVRIDTISNNPNLPMLHIPKGVTIESITHNRSLATLSIAEGANILQIHRNPALSELIIHKCADVECTGDNHPGISIRRVES